MDEEQRSGRLSRTKALCALVAIFLAAAGLRLYGLHDLSPPGLEHDEVANWLIDRSILAGRHAVYFAEAYGHEAGFHYVQAAFVGLLGDHALALRLPAAFAGLLGVAVTYALARLLFGRGVGLIAAGLLAVLFWPVFYSRLGLRVILLPPLSGLSAYFWWRGWRWAPAARNLPSARSSPDALGDTQTESASLRYLALAGLFAGLSLHTYMAARVVPVFYLLFVGYLALFHRRGLRSRWRGVALFWLALIIVALPLVAFLLANPGAEYRISEIDAPLRALFAGNLRPVVDNSVDILGMFGWRGDPLWRQNVAFWPVFDPLIAAFFYGCLAFFVLRFRNIRHAFLLLWILTAFIPSIVTIDAPSSIRIGNILPVLTILPAIVMHSLGHLSTETEGLSTAVKRRWLPFLGIALVLLFHLARTVWAVYFVWPANPEVQFVWQEALTEAAFYLDALDDAGSVAVGGWTPETMDPPTMELALRREDLALRFFHPEQAVLLPAGALGETARLVYPTILPPHRALQAQLDRWGMTSSYSNAFTAYELDALPSPAPHFPAAVSFGQELVFRGHTFFEGCRPAAAGPCQIVTFWRVVGPAAGPRRFFLHAVTDDGEIAATGDGLGAPAVHWRPGDLIVQRHQLEVDAIAPYTLNLGVYNPETGRRLLTDAGADHAILKQAGERSSDS